MKDRNDVIEALEYLISADCTETQFDYYNDIKTAIAMLKEQGTANLYKCPNCGTWVSAENVVWCKDCKHAGEDCEIAFHFGEKDDWFCADGERKVGEGNENP